MRTTLDELIAALQAQKEAGLSGDTLVGIPERDNNGVAGMIRMDIKPHVGAIAKTDARTNWELCRTVSRGGVPVLVIS